MKKKYRVTEKHPGLKIDCTISELKYDTIGGFRVILYEDKYMAYIPLSEFEYQIKDGWIEEIQEKEFTKDDVIDILIKYNEGYVEEADYCNWDNLINEFKSKK